MKAYFITCPEAPEREEKAKAHFHEVGIGVNPFTGIHAATAGLRTIHTYEIDNPGTNYHIGPSSIGNVLSQYMLWGALSLLSDNHYMVLESDAKFPDDWKKRFNQAMFDAPADFDLLYIGSCCCKGKPSTHVKGEVFEVKYPLCTHAYVVAAKCLPYLLKTMRRVWAPIDIQLSMEALPQLKVFTVLPRIVSQFDTVIPP